MRCRLACGGDFALDVFERVSPVDVEVGMAECPALWMNAVRRTRVKQACARTCSPNWLSSEFLTWVRCEKSVWNDGEERAYLVKVVFVELADKGSKIGVLEHAGEDGLCKLVHVLDDEAVAVGTPGDDVCPRGVLEHPGGAGRLAAGEGEGTVWRTHL